MKVGLECDDVVGRFGDQGGCREMLPPLRTWLHVPVYKHVFPGTPASAAWLCTAQSIGVRGTVVRPGVANPLLGRRFVGICFGHQMLAHAMGGEVAKAKQGWGVGVLGVEVLKKEPWMEPPLARIQIQHMHQDQVQKLPADSVLLGRSPHCDVAIVGGHVDGVLHRATWNSPSSSAALIPRAGANRRARDDRALRACGKTDSTVGHWIARFLTTLAKRFWQLQRFFEYTSGSHSMSVRWTRPSGPKMTCISFWMLA